jgi:hypothetical protein
MMKEARVAGTSPTTRQRCRVPFSIRTSPGDSTTSAPSSSSSGGDDETLEYGTHLLRDADLQVFGRKTYQLMVPYWPEVTKNPSETKASIELARTFDSINKMVFSRSLDGAEDRIRELFMGTFTTKYLN